MVLSAMEPPEGGKGEGSGDTAERQRRVGFVRAKTMGAGPTQNASRSTTSKSILSRAKSSIGESHVRQGEASTHRGVSVKWPDMEPADGLAISSGSRETVPRKETGKGVHGQTADNSAMEAEAAEHAVNYHRVRRKVQEDIRKALVQNPVIRQKLQGPRVMPKDTINFLSNPSDHRSPMNGFNDDNTMDWITAKTAETSRQRAIQRAKDEELQEYKEEQNRELALFRQRKEEVQRRGAYEARREMYADQARREVANKKIAGNIRSNEALKYAKERREKIQHAKQMRTGKFTAQGLHTEKFNGM